MKRTNEIKLKHALLDSRLFFIPRGKHELSIIYTYVKASFPHLCDDTITCSRKTGEDYGGPEWQHYTRLALNKLKEMGVITQPERKYYIFN
jgi:hypothetical protein